MFLAAAPDQYNVAAWATITKKGSFNFGTIKKVDPIMMKLDAVGMGWLVVYHAPEQYGQSYIASHFMYTYTTVNTAANPTVDVTTPA